MINFVKSKCPKCGKEDYLMFSNNPLSGPTICFHCIAQNLQYTNLSHADFFCRTYNLPFDPELWMEVAKDYQNEECFKQYTSITLEDAKYNDEKTNLYYTTSTRDLWAKTNREWEKTRSFIDVLDKLPDIKESYVKRRRLKWGEQYTFEDLIKLDSIFTRTIKANNITNPLQGEAVKTLCKLQIEMDEAIRAKDAKAIKDFSSAWSTFAKQADLETMINETKTDDITTVAELYQYLEDRGFRLRFYDSFPRDEVDLALKDIQDANRRTILETTGLQTLLEEMIRSRMIKDEQTYTDEATTSLTVQDLINFKAEDNDIETENDSDAENLDFSEDKETNSPTVIIQKESK